MLEFLLLCGSLVVLSIFIWREANRRRKPQYTDYAKSTSLLPLRTNIRVLGFLLLLGWWWESKTQRYKDKAQLLIHKRHVENRDNSAKATDSLALLIVILLLLWLFKSREHVTNKAASQTPPTFVESVYFFLHEQTFVEALFFFLPRWEREMLIGDLDEEYCEIFKKFGIKQAQRWYGRQVATSLLPLLIATIKRIVMRSIRRWTS